MNRFIVLLLILLFPTALILIAREQPGQKNSESPAASYAQIEDIQTLWNINNIAGWIRNDGFSAHNPLTAQSGVWYPRGTATVIYQDGIVWGGKVTQSHWQQPEGSFRAGGQTYRIGTTPGYIVQPGTPTTPPFASNPNEAYIYRIRADWQTLTVNDPEVIQDAAELNNVDPSQVTQAMAQEVLAGYEWAWNNWPVELGAPFYDNNGNGVYDPPTDEPGLQNADQVIWFVCNDLAEGTTSSLYGSQPIGLELQVTIWGYHSEGPLGQATYHRFRLINKSGFPADSMFIAAKWSDPDLGDYTNDFVGCDSILDMGYCYNGYPTDPDYQQFGLPPAAIGYAILQGPIVPSPGDTAWFDFRKIPDFKNLPMTSFGYNATGDPVPDPILGDYEGTLQWYNWLNGYIPFADTLNLFPYIHGCGSFAGRPTKFPLNGDPVTGIGDIDGCGSNLSPGDRRMTINTGPFTLQNGDTQEVVFAVVGGIDPNGDHLSAVAKLKENVQLIRSQFPEPMALPQVSHRTNFPTNTTTELLVRADLNEFSGVTGSEVNFAPETGSEPGFNLQLFDDGMHNDSLAGDNIWGNTVTIDNRKYPFRGDLTVHTSTDQQTYEGVYAHLRLRPLPDFSNWRVVWENGQQDFSINNSEKVHLAFDLQNRDNLNPISNAAILNYEPISLNQVIQISQAIPPGGTVSSDSSYFILLGPSTGDSLTFSYRLQFDNHSVVLSTTRPVVPWSPPPAWGDTLAVNSIRGVTENVFPVVADENLLNGHLYMITFFEDAVSLELRWQLIDLTTAVIKVDNGIVTSAPNFPHPVVDGILWMVTDTGTDYTSFRVVANAAGTLDPPEQGCFAFNNNGFPFLNGSDRPDPARQQTNGSTWGIHTGMISGNDGTFEFFKDRVTQGGARWPLIVPDDWEIRFTAGPNWGFEPLAFVTGQTTGGTPMQMPFEIWNIGNNTPDDPSDDYRLFPYLIDSEADGMFNIAPIDHILSNGVNDPETDWFYWVIPADQTSGQAGYMAIENEITTNPSVHEYLGPLTAGTDAMRRMVLVNFNGGDVTDPTFPANLNAVMPEEGTVFRIITSKPNFPGDTLRVLGSVGIAEQQTPDVFELHQNYPNPFNPETHIRFSLAHKVKVKLEIFNVLGQRVKTLVDNDMAPGKHEMLWNGRNDAGNRVSSGIYFYRIEAGGYVKSRKMILLR